MNITRTQYSQVEITVEPGSTWTPEKIISILPTNKKIVLVGGFGSGKTFLASKLQSVGRRVCVSHTDREARVGEVDGVDYHFCTPKQILTLLNYTDSIQWDKFVNGCYYVTTRAEFDRSDVLILTPRGLNKFPLELRQRMCVVYLDINPETRIERYKAREGVSYSIEDRIKEEATQFAGFMNWDVRITDYASESSSVK